jgi:transposase-like protein
LSVGRKIEDEREAVRCLRAAERQGVSAGEWARAHGVDGRSMHAWQMNLARRGTTSPRKQRKARPKAVPAAHTLVELVPAAMPGMQGASCCGARLLT